MTCTFGIGDRLEVVNTEYTQGREIAGLIVTVEMVLPAPCGDPDKKAIFGTAESGETVFLMDRHLKYASHYLQTIDVKADDKCKNCYADFADHNYDESRDLYVCPHKGQHTGYGGFKGGDPRNFSPDHECCHENEIALWRACCERWNQADAKGITMTPEALQTCRNELGISGAGWKFGIGVYTIEYEQTWEKRDE